MKNIDIAAAKKSYQLANAGKRFEAYTKMAYCTADVRGSLANLQNTIDLVNKEA